MIENIFILLIVYQIKHFIIDYPLQNKYMLQKFLPNWGFFWPLATHAGYHAVGTMVIAHWWFFPDFSSGNIKTILGLALFDFIIHFTMDRIKAGPKYLGRFKPLSPKEFMHILSYKDTIGLEQFSKEIKGNTYFWWSLGLDQSVHHLTHYACIWFMVTR